MFCSHAERQACAGTGSQEPVRAGAAGALTPHPACDATVCRAVASSTFHYAWHVVHGHRQKERLPRAQIDPGNVRTLCAVATLERKCGHHKAARMHLRAALELQPDNPAALQVLQLPAPWS